MNSPERIDVVGLTMRLAEILPKCIVVYEKNRKPLQVGIRDQIIARIGDVITPDELGRTLRAYTRNIGYLRAMAQPGAMRIDIEGNPVEAVTPKQAASSAKAVARTGHGRRRARPQRGRKRKR
jgi:sRNA-binding protein